MVRVKTKMSEGGRVVIPAEFRKALDLKPGDELLLFLDKGEIRLMTPAQAIKKVQEWARSIIPPGVSLVDELLQERREEAAREDREYHE
jgi:AbrB family looped-hinge helix DNA binding protein